MELKDKLNHLLKDASEKIDQSQTIDEVNQLRIELLGKKGQLTDLLKMMKDVEPSQRPIIGKLANEIRDILTNKISDKNEVLTEAALEKQLKAETISVPSTIS